MQAKLFRIFQEVLNAPAGHTHEELRKLAVYVVRQFTVQATKNAKAFAELLVWKSARECADLENGYETQQDDTKRGWTEAQEDELQRLFDENQANPATDKGIIVFQLLVPLLALSLVHSRNLVLMRLRIKLNHKGDYCLMHGHIDEWLSLAGRSVSPKLDPWRGNHMSNWPNVQAINMSGHCSIIYQCYVNV